MGENRVVFGLIRQGKGPIKDAQVTVETFLLTPPGRTGRGRQFQRSSKSGREARAGSMSQP